MILLNSIWLSLFFLNVIYYFWLCWVFVLHKLFSSCGQQGPLSSRGAQASHCDGFSCCESQPLEHRLSNSGARVYLPWGMWDLPGLRDRTCVSYIGRQILYHWATREAPLVSFFNTPRLSSVTLTLWARQGIMSHSHILQVKKLSLQVVKAQMNVAYFR